MNFIGKIQEMSQADILDHIPTSAYMRIKEADPHPEFRAYVIGEEGESTGKLIGVGSVVKRWARSAIQKLHEKIQFGMKAYHEHNRDNSHTGRQAVGETVGKFLREAGGKLQTILISYIYPEYRKEQLDAASIEADIELKTGPNGHDVDVLDVTGVAFGDKNKFKPGFANAGLILKLQEFEDKIKGDTKPMTKDEIKQLIASEGYRPCDLFDRNSLMQDSIVANHIEETTRKEYAKRMKAENELKEFQDTQKEAVKGVEAERDKYRSKALLSMASDILKKEVAEKNKERELISPKALKYIEKSLSTLPITDEEKLPEAVKSFVDQKMTDFIEIFGDETVKENENAGSPKQEQQQQGQNQERPYFLI